MVVNKARWHKKAMGFFSFFLLDHGPFFPNSIGNWWRHVFSLSSFHHAPFFFWVGLSGCLTSLFPWNNVYNEHCLSIAGRSGSDEDASWFFIHVFCCSDTIALLSFLFIMCFIGRHLMTLMTGADRENSYFEWSFLGVEVFLTFLFVVFFVNGYPAKKTDYDLHDIECRHSRSHGSRIQMNTDDWRWNILVLPSWFLSSSSTDPIMIFVFASLTLLPCLL